jgi:hypothetical protein
MITQKIFLSDTEPMRKVRIWQLPPLTPLRVITPVVTSFLSGSLFGLLFLSEAPSSPVTPPAVTTTEHVHITTKPTMRLTKAPETRSHRGRSTSTSAKTTKSNHRRVDNLGTDVRSPRTVSSTQQSTGGHTIGDLTTAVPTQASTTTTPTSNDPPQE